MQWVGHDPTHRAPHLGRLLEHVHFQLMSPNEVWPFKRGQLRLSLRRVCCFQVEQYRRDSRVKKTKNLAIAFEEAKRYAAADPAAKIRYWTERGGGGAHGRKPPRWPKILVVMRMYWKNLPMEYYDFKAKQWNRLADVRERRDDSTIRK